MNILIHFEDSHGCASLFEYSKCFKSNALNITVVQGLSNSGVYNISKAQFQKYDKIIVVFDLDAMGVKGVQSDVSLTSQTLLVHLKNKGIVDNNGNLTAKCQNKLVFIPVEFCYETINLYSDHLIGVLNNLDNYNKTQNIEILKLLKSYYDYTKLHPEYFDGAANIAEEIHTEICKITEDNLGDEWKAQQIHLSFSKNLLTTYFRVNNYNLSSDSLCKKKETKLFLEMKSQNTELQPETMIDDFYNKAVVNKLFADLMMCQNEQDIETLCSKATLVEAIKLVDKYNKIIKKTFNKNDVKQSVKLCIANIEIMLSNKVRSINKITKTLKNNGFDDSCIKEAINIMSNSR